MCELLTILTSYGQVNIPNMAAFEIISRRLQNVEESKENLLAARAAAGTGAASAFEMDQKCHFLGRDKGEHRALVCPALSAYVASQLRDEAMVLKERRKGREEWTAASKG